MSSDQLQDADQNLQGSPQVDGGGEPLDGEEDLPQPLQLDVQVSEPSACERHVTVSIARDDIERYLDEAYSELMSSAAVPGFRPGRAPRKLVEGHFRKEINERVKGTLLMDSLTQVSEQQEFTAISEPNFDLEAVELPDEGPMTFEFDIEVRPEFDLPEWKGLKVARPVKEFTDKDVDARLEQVLARHGSLVPVDEAAQSGDFVTCNVTCSHDGKEISSLEEEPIRIRKELSFHDAKLEGFDKLMQGAKAGDSKTAQVELTQDAENEALRGEKVDVKFDVLEVKKLDLPELTPDFLQEIGGFDSVEKLREAIRQDLQRQLEYQQQQRIRQQITSALTASAKWELPPAMLRRQSTRELERMVLELRRNGYSEAEIRASENELRRNTIGRTATALKEHFILERIAEEMKLDAEASDYDAEIYLIAMQSGDTPRRVRAQLEKRGMMDVLRNQIIERKVLELVRQHANFKDEPFKDSPTEVEAIDLAAGGMGAEDASPSAAEAAAKTEG